ncbi:hypothetical protein CJJ23_02260, partial [Mycoplasmopsis agassizii]
HFSRLVNIQEIQEKNYNLAVNTYVAKHDNREVVDITKLNSEINVIVKNANHLRESIDNIINEIETRE